MKLVKYPRTFHFPWSESNSSDDVWWTADDVANYFHGKEVVVSEKMDGESTSMYNGHIHARSMDSGHHPSRAWVKQLLGTFGHNIPQDFRICGENLFAFHSIYYTDLPSYFMVYGIYDDNNYCLSWDDTLLYVHMLGLETVPILYRGIWDEKLIRNLWTGKGVYPTYSSPTVRRQFPEDFEACTAEGYVVRLAEKFHYDDFSKSVAKMVRKNHVSTPTNWMTMFVVPNQLKVP